VCDGLGRLAEPAPKKRRRAKKGARARAADVSRPEAEQPAPSPAHEPEPAAEQPPPSPADELAVPAAPEATPEPADECLASNPPPAGSDGLCCACGDARCDSLSLACRHLCLCSGCAAKLQNGGGYAACPLCRTWTSFLTVYLC
jgi:hypothetical protein